MLGEDGGLHAEMDEGFKDLLARMESAYESSPVLPEGFGAALRDYQMQGYQWMVRLDSWGAGACLADDMGLGKPYRHWHFCFIRRYGTIACGCAHIHCPKLGCRSRALRSFAECYGPE